MTGRHVENITEGARLIPSAWPSRPAAVAQVGSEHRHSRGTPVPPPKYNDTIKASDPVVECVAPMSGG